MAHRADDKINFGRVECSVYLEGIFRLAWGGCMTKKVNQAIVKVQDIDLPAHRTDFHFQRAEKNSKSSKFKLTVIDYKKHDFIFLSHNLSFLQSLNASISSSRLSSRSC